jgi:hypothetical protein
MKRTTHSNGEIVCYTDKETDPDDFKREVIHEDGTIWIHWFNNTMEGCERDSRPNDLTVTKVVCRKVCLSIAVKFLKDAYMNFVNATTKFSVDSGAESVMKANADYNVAYEVHRLAKEADMIAKDEMNVHTFIDPDYLKQVIETGLQDYANGRFDQVIFNYNSLYLSQKIFLKMHYNWRKRYSYAVVLNSLKNAETLTPIMKVFQCNDIARVIGSYV